INSIWTVQAVRRFRRPHSVFIACCSKKQKRRRPNTPAFTQALQSPHMSQPSLHIEPPIRPEFEYPLSALRPATQAESIREPLSLAQRLLNHDGVRKILILVVLAVIWEVVGRWQDNELLLPTFTATIGAMWADLVNGELPARMAISLSVLLQGYALGVILAFFLTTFAISTRLGRDVLSTL